MATCAARLPAWPSRSCGGESALMSNATRSRPARARIRRSPSLADSPPHEGVVTPGATEGSKTSMSQHT
jgi:hypothetical protein